jgi:hypothetical protein
MSPPTKVGKRKGTKREEGKKSLEADRHTLRKKTIARMIQNSMC